MSLQPGNDWLAAAKAYRSWLQERGELVSLESKLAAVKDGKRLIGASHLYLWGETAGATGCEELARAAPPDPC